MTRLLGLSLSEYFRRNPGDTLSLPILHPEDHLASRQQCVDETHLRG
jgi:hypothetical protein